MRFIKWRYIQIPCTSDTPHPNHPISVFRIAFHTFVMGGIETSNLVGRLTIRSPIQPTDNKLPLKLEWTGRSHDPFKFTWGPIMYLERVVLLTNKFNCVLYYILLIFVYGDV